MTRTYGTACVPCRRLKIKCITTGPDPSRCDRCARVGRQCFGEPRRRRSAKHVDQNDVGTSNANVPPERDTQRDAQNRDATTYPVQPLENFNALKPLFGNYNLPSVRSQPTSTIGNHTARDVGTSSSSSPLDNPAPVAASSPGARSDDSAGFTPPAFVSHSEDARILSLDAILDPKSLAAKSSSERADSSRESNDIHNQNDPIHLRILNRPSAQHLYEGYFTHFEYNVGFLDPALYTFDYTRQRSSFLFTALMSISARVFRPDLVPALRKHAEMLLGKVLLSCEAEIENIWAIVCMYYWKDLGDNRGYTLVGFAMRLAAASDWHGGRRSAYTGYDETSLQRRKKLTEMEARKLRDQDRVWLYLGSLDRTLSFFTDRPLASIVVAPDLGSRSWMRTSNPWTYPYGDARALAGQELTDIAKPVHDYVCSTRRLGRIMSSATDDTTELATAIHKLNDSLIAWVDYWAPIFAAHETGIKILEAQIHMYSNQIRTFFNSILLHRVLVSTGNSVTSDRAVDAIRSCYNTALAVLREAIKFGRTEVLYYLWDTAHLMIAYAAMVIVKLLKQAPSCPGISLQEAYDVLKEAADVHTAAARSMSAETNEVESGSQAAPRTTVEAQARLLKSILFRMKADILPSSLRPEELPGTADPSTVSEFTSMSPPISYGIPVSGFTPPLLSGVTEGPVGITTDASSELRWNEAQQMADLAGDMAGDMDLSLDTSFIENWFTQAGLLPWDEPGMFKEPR